MQSKKKLVMVQGRAARYSTNKYHNTSTCSVTDDLNWEKDQTSSRGDIQDGI